VQLPSTKNSPSFDAYAPYTPAVLNLIAQLEPSNPPTQAQLANADAILHDGANSSCHNVGPVGTPAGTTPSIMALCWTDAQGVNVTSGPNVRNTTAPMTLLGLGATFDRTVGNVWGQTEGSESRELMVTGMFGPQSAKKYNLTLSLSAWNMLNHANYSPPSGDLSSPFFGQYRTLAGMGPLGTPSTYNRRVMVQLRLMF